MAKASWNTVSPASGTGNGTFTTGASTHTGRSTRSSTLTIAASGATSKTVTVTQSAAGNILMGSDTVDTFVKAGEAKTVTGMSNTTKLTFAITGTGFSISSPKISTDGTTWTGITSGVAITGDPGAAARYAWQITVTATANPTVSQRTATLTLTPNEGGALTIGLTQEAGNATLSVSPATVTIPAAGTGQTVTVTSNTSWTVS